MQNWQRRTEFLDFNLVSVHPRTEPLTDMHCATLMSPDAVSTGWRDKIGGIIRLTK